MSDLKIINLILDIFRNVDSAYITEYLVLSYIEKLISTVGYFLATFCWLVNCMSWMSYYFSYLNYATCFIHVQKIKHCLYLKPFSVFICAISVLTILYILSFCLVFKLYKSNLQILYIVSDHFWALLMLQVA